MRRTTLFSLASAALLVAAGAVATPVSAGAPPVEIVPSATMVRVGATIDFRGEFCAVGATVTSITSRAVPARAKGLPPFMPLDPVAAGLAQDATGFGFHVVASQEYTAVEVQVECSDGTTGATTAGVEVFPAAGFLWAFNNYDPYFTATQGYLFGYGAGVIDCVAGGKATATITPPSSTTAIVTLDGTVGPDRHVVFDIDVPATWASGVYTGTIVCATASGTVRDSQPIYVGVQPGDGATGVPGTGAASGTTALLALAFLLVGSAMTFAVRRRPAPVDR